VTPALPSEYDAAEAFVEAKVMIIVTVETHVTGYASCGPGGVVR